LHGYNLRIVKILGAEKFFKMIFCSYVKISDFMFLFISVYYPLFCVFKFSATFFLQFRFFALPDDVVKNFCAGAFFSFVGKPGNKIRQSLYIRGKIKTLKT